MINKLLLITALDNNIMEQCRGNDTSSISNATKADISPKSKQKKKSLCQMLMNKKTRVGCLETYKDTDSNKNSKADNSQHESHTSTKLSLCCAMTERSRTPPQSLTASRLSPTTLSRTSVKSEVASINGKCLIDVLVEKQEVYSMHVDQEAEDSNTSKKVIMREKEQRKSTYTEGKV
ncbi:hypothetical protein M0802_004961 [Mischocyttarus mexicanus]|nr:hypothetical protein M0802_004961 [Mischocyttarus mexicanus]